MGVFRRAKCAREEGCEDRSARTKMMPELKMNRPLDTALWWSSRDDGVPHHGGCKYLISRRLPRFFTIFSHFSYHFSVVSVWFLASCRQMMVYLNCGVFAKTKSLSKQIVFRKRSWNSVCEPTRAMNFGRLTKVAERWEGPRLMPYFPAISGYFRLFPAKIKGRGVHLRLALLRRLQPVWSGARVFAARLNQKYNSWNTC